MTNASRSRAKQCPSRDEAIAAAKAAFEALRAKLDGYLNSGNDVYNRLALMEYHRAFFNWSATLPNHQTIFDHWYRGMEYAQHVRLLRSIGESEFSAGLLHDTMGRLRAWAKAEKEIVDRGYRAVSLEDFIGACKDPGFNRNIPQPVHHLLRIEREAGEQPVCHAQDLLQAHA